MFDCLDCLGIGLLYSVILSCGSVTHAFRVWQAQVVGLIMDCTDCVKVVQPNIISNDGDINVLFYRCQLYIMLK